MRTGAAPTLAEKLASVRAQSQSLGVGGGVMSKLEEWERELEGREREAKRLGDEGVRS